MPFKIVQSSKSPPTARRNPLRNRSYDVVPVPGRKEYPSRAYPPRTLPPQIPSDSVAIPRFDSEEQFPSLSPSKVSQLDSRAIELEASPLGNTDYIPRKKKLPFSYDRHNKRIFFKNFCQRNGLSALSIRYIYSYNTT